MGLIAVVGFWPTYFGPLVTGTIAQPLLIHIHATVFTGWLVLFLTQAILAATKHVTWHLRLGKIGIGYGALLVVVGLSTGVMRSSRLPLGGEAEDLLFAATADMVVFSSFFTAAIVYRRKPQVHKRLMMVAANMLLIAAVARMTFIPPPPGGLPLFLTIWFLPLIAAMAYDWWSQRRIHAVVSGKVQGVGFRAFTQEEAEKLKLTGYVRNLKDGRVELVAEGRPDDVSTLLTKIKQGPPGARVDKIDSKEEAPTGESGDFKVDR